MLSRSSFLSVMNDLLVNYQSWLAGGVVLITAAVFAKRLFFKKKGRGCGHCGCGTKSPVKK